MGGGGGGDRWGTGRGVQVRRQVDRGQGNRGGQVKDRWGDRWGDRVTGGRGTGGGTGDRWGTGGGTG